MSSSTPIGCYESVQKVLKTNLWHEITNRLQLQSTKETVLQLNNHKNQLLDNKLFSLYYNIPRVCLLNRPPVPAMDLKDNRLGLWRHMLETCRRLTRLCRKRSSTVARHDKTPVKSTLLSRDKNILSRYMIFMSRWSDIMMWLLYV